MKKIFFLAILLMFCSVSLLPKEDPWGNLKKISFYDSLGDDQKVLAHLKLIDFEGLKRADQDTIASQLIRFGDNYLEKGKDRQAEAFYRKVLTVSPNDAYWTVYNKLEKINRMRGHFFISFKNLFSQLFLVLKNFNASFLLLNQVFNLLFFSGLFTFLIFSLILFIKYFKLTGNDLLIKPEGGISLNKMAIVIVILLWPVIFLSGWMIYPFLVAGFLWFYLNEKEKKAVKYMILAIVVLTVLYALNLVLEKNAQTSRFQQVYRVYAGERFDKDIYDTFDDNIKIAQAFSYYENGKLDEALDILNSTGDSFKSTQKYDLIGNIYYRRGDIDHSIKYYSESLKMDDDNKVALNNFTLALLKDNQPEVFKSYAQRYPQIEKLRPKAVDIKDIKLNRGVLWRWLFNPSRHKFSPVGFLKNMAGELFKLPVVYFILIFIIYVMGLKKIAPALGESTYCSKCAKIIKEASIHKSYKLCDECYQLFSIKDVIFLEAKILKEKELKKSFKSRYILSLLFSAFIPGLNFNHRGNNRLFLLLSVIFYFLAGFAVVGVINFSRSFSFAPLFLNLIGMAAFGFFLLVNIFSVLGDEDGF
jgi:tetratricopeptide (TPR) repeat protein